MNIHSDLDETFLDFTVCFSVAVGIFNCPSFYLVSVFNKIVENCIKHLIFFVTLFLMDDSIHANDFLCIKKDTKKDYYKMLYYENN